MNKQTRKGNFPWAILIGGLLFQGAFVGILTNGTGLVISAIILDRGFTAGALSPYYTIKMLAGAATITTMTSLYFRWGAKKYLTLMATVCCVSFGAMALFTEPWHWYVDAVVIGVFSGNAMMLVPCIINNWFQKYNGVITGTVMAASGLTGAAISPICSKWISAFGWEKTAVLIGVIVGVLCIFSAWFLLRLRPSDCNGTPYGEGEQVHSRQKSGQSSFGSTKPGLLMVTCTGMLLSGVVMVQLTNYFPLYATSIGFDLQIGAVMTSCIMVGNVVGKFSAGALSDRIGPWKTGICVIAAVAAAMGILMTEPGSQLFLYGASALFGLTYSVSTVLSSLVCLDAFGSETYAKRLSKITAFNTLMGAGCNFLVADIYDKTASFRLVFLLGIVLCCSSMCFAIAMLILRRKRVQ